VSCNNLDCEVLIKDIIYVMLILLIGKQSTGNHIHVEDIRNKSI
jgi:hypothetical protein